MIRNATSQPKGLFLLFFTELWERFGFYTLQTIIILYMSQGLKMPDEDAYLLYGAFSSLLFLTPVIGGYIADHYLGFQRAILWGASLLFLGYLCTSSSNPVLFFIGLSLIIVGNGLFKPNVSSIVGSLYEPGDPRRDGGFTLFYMGINVGALLPPLFAGELVKAFGWHMGFFFAAIGMLISLVIFWIGRSLLGKAGVIPSISMLLKGHEQKRKFWFVFVSSLAISTILVYFFLKLPKQSDLILIVASIVILAFLFYFLAQQPKQQKYKMIVALMLTLISVGFWAIYNQTFTSLMLFAERNMSKHWLGFPIDAEFTQFFNPFFIIVLSPILSQLWIYLDQKKLNPSTPAKFAFGVLFMALGFFFLDIGSRFFGEVGITSAWWLVGSYFLQTIGELLISPIGLAMITELSPPHLVGMMMGVWFLTQSAAYAIGSLLSTLADVPDKLSAQDSLEIYSKAFFEYGLLALALALATFLLIPFMKKLLKKH